jgi:hypothetical protein
MPLNIPKPLDEVRLIARCLHGEESAWVSLFRNYHPPLLLIVRSFLRREGRAEQAEEITANVWCSLCSETYVRLRRYDPQKARFLGYLVGIARFEILSGRRADRNRYLRECRVARHEATFDEADWRLMMQEFLSTLTHREREFCLTDLMRLEAAEGARDFSETNAWKLRSRVLKKFEKYYAQELR